MGAKLDPSKIRVLSHRNCRLSPQRELIKDGEINNPRPHRDTTKADIAIFTIKTDQIKRLFIRLDANNRAADLTATLDLRLYSSILKTRKTDRLGREVLLCYSKACDRIAVGSRDHCKVPVPVTLNQIIGDLVELGLEFPVIRGLNFRPGLFRHLRDRRFPQDNNLAIRTRFSRKDLINHASPQGPRAIGRSMP